MNSTFTDKKAIAVFVLPAFITFAGIILIPLMTSFSYSLHDWNGFSGKVFNGFQNYMELFTEKSFLLSLKNTGVLGLLTLLIQIPAALVLALILAHGIKGEKHFRVIYFIPAVLSSTVIGLLWRRIYDPTFGLLNRVLEVLGMEELTRAWLGDLDTVLLAVCAPIVWQWIGYHMLLMYAGAKGISKDIREAAKIDGAGGVQTALKICLPLMKPVIKVCIIFSIIGTIKHFDLVYILTNGGPAHASEVPSTLMITTLFKKYNYGMGSAMAMVIVFGSLLVTVLFQKFFKTEEYS